MIPFSPLTNNRVFTFPDESGTLVVSPSLMTNGQVLIGSTGINPVASNITANGVGNLITITNGPGTITISSTAAATNGGAFSQSNPPNPNSAPVFPGAAVMMGLNGAITPANTTGRVMIIISGDAQGNANGGGGIMQIRYGTGAAPANGAAVVGAAVGSAINFGLKFTGSVIPFDLNAIATGLVQNTTYWVDISLQSTVAGNASVNDVSVSIIEF